MVTLETGHTTEMIRATYPLTGNKKNHLASGMRKNCFALQATSRIIHCTVNYKRKKARRNYPGSLEEVPSLPNTTEHASEGHGSIGQLIDQNVYLNTVPSTSLTGGAIGRYLANMSCALNREKKSGNKKHPV